MISLKGLMATMAFAQLTQLPYSIANFDHATGHLRDWRPTSAWSNKNSPLVRSPHVQASECGINTRLHSPKVQLFAHFIVDPTANNHHGCPYGACLAYDILPEPGDLEPAFTESQLFFWHDTGGLPGNGVHNITNPRTGTLGYESSISGLYHDGVAPLGSEQVEHDSHYRGFDPTKLKKWTPEERKKFEIPGYKEPPHMVCAQPCQENQDPGSDNGAWVPTPASAYRPPPEWKPSRPQDQCWSNGRRTGPTSDPRCEGFCKCAKKCSNDAGCIKNKCKNKKNCKPESCSASSGTNPPGTNPPGTDPPGTDPPGTNPPGTNPPGTSTPNSKCKAYCKCAKKCKPDHDSCFSSCPNTDSQCSPDTCATSGTNPSGTNPIPTDPNPSDPNPINPSPEPSDQCSNYCSCAQDCNDDSTCVSKCANKDSQCTQDACSNSKNPSKLSKKPKNSKPSKGNATTCALYCNCMKGCDGSVAKCPVECSNRAGGLCSQSDCSSGKRKRC